MADIASKLTPDRYTVQARLLPAFALLLPVGLAAAAFEPVAAVGVPGGAGLALVATVLLAGRVRTAGRAVQTRLWDLEGAPPSTRALRWSNDVPAAVQQRRHQLLQGLTGVPLPTATQEATDPGRADQAYTAAVRALIERTRDHGLLLAENIAYGMWRNLYAVKPTGIVLTVTAAATTTVATAFGVLTPAGAVGPLLMDVVLLGVWIGVVTLDQLLDAQQIYVDQLLHTAESARPV